MSQLDVVLSFAVVLVAGAYLAWVLFGARGRPRGAAQKAKTDDDCCGPT